LKLQNVNFKKFKKPCLDFTSLLMENIVFHGGRAPNWRTRDNTNTFTSLLMENTGRNKYFISSKMGPVWEMTIWKSIYGNIITYFLGIQNTIVSQWWRNGWTISCNYSYRKNEILTIVFDEEEIFEVISQIKHNKTPKPDGFPVEFKEEIGESLKMIYGLVWQLHKGDLPKFNWIMYPKGECDGNTTM
jgi:hypothetical protein